LDLGTGHHVEFALPAFGRRDSFERPFTVFGIGADFYTALRLHSVVLAFGTLDCGIVPSPLTLHAGLKGSVRSSSPWFLLPLWLFMRRVSSLRFIFPFAEKLLASPFFRCNSLYHAPSFPLDLGPFLSQGQFAVSTTNFPVDCRFFPLHFSPPKRRPSPPKQRFRPQHYGPPPPSFFSPSSSSRLTRHLCLSSIRLMWHPPILFYTVLMGWNSPSSTNQIIPTAPF